MLFPFVFPQGIVGIVSVNVWPDFQKLRSETIYLLWVKDPSPVAKEWPLSTFLVWPDAVNGPDVMFGQNTSVSRLAIFPEDAGSDRPMDGENKGIPIGHRNVISDDVNHPCPSGLLSDSYPCR